MSVDYRDEIQKLKLLREMARLEQAQAEANLAKIHLRPSYFLPTTVYRDGSNWVCIVHTAKNLTECPVAYGSSPEAAMVNFDNLWLGRGVEVQPPAEGHDQEEKYPRAVYFDEDMEDVDYGEDDEDGEVDYDADIDDDDWGIR